MATGIAGTVIFHLILLIVFLTVKLGEVKQKHQELIAIEFAEEEYKPIEQIIEESKPEITDMPQLDQKTLSNVVSNAAEEINKEISTEKYIEEVMKELGMEEINPQYDNSLPDDPELLNKSENKEKDNDKSRNFGPTRISYKMEDGRRHKFMDRPIYRCQGGGTVVIDVVIDQEGNVLETKVASTSTSETCVSETALESAGKFLFKPNPNSPKRVKGTITYIFVAQ